MKFVPFILAALVTPAAAQLDNEWLQFTRSDALLGVAPGAVSGPSDEVDFAVGDLDLDGDEDLVVVRKQPFGAPGKRTNVLLMNEGGVLQDRTAALASSADVSGDKGFLTATPDQDVVLADLDGDGFPEAVTATNFGFTDPKHIGHPRVYQNLGASGGGAWLGLRFEDGRIPQLLQLGSGQPANPGFHSVAAGDLTRDGFAELYFGDGDFNLPGSLAPPDLGDRLLYNDGNGFFQDASQLVLPPSAQHSGATVTAQIVDVNQDGAADVVRDDGYLAPVNVEILYGDPLGGGSFPAQQVVETLSPYYFDLGDLNNDGRPDIVFSSDLTDRYRYHDGVDASGEVVWSAPLTFEFLAGGDDGFAGNNLIEDLDGDGWNDVVITDVHENIPGLNRRVHIYHNPGGVPGSHIVLREEREKSGSGGWVGAEGLLEKDLRGGHDAATLDLDGDGDRDLVLGRGVGTFVWVNQAVPNRLLSDASALSLSAGGTQNFSLVAGDAHAGQLYLLLASASGTSPGLGVDGHVLPLNIDAVFVQALSNPGSPPWSGTFGALDAEGEGKASLTVPAGSNPALAGTVLHHAYAVLDASGGVPVVTVVSNAVPTQLAP